MHGSGGMHGMGACVAWGHVWQGVYMVGDMHGRGCLPRGCVPCDLSHHAFDVTCMLSLHQLRLITSAAAYIVFGHVTCDACLDRMTDTCKTLPFCKLCLRAVKISEYIFCFSRLPHRDLS